jgi:hypothetical protein
MPSSDDYLLTFLDAQMRAYGATAELETGLWSLFVVPAGDSRANSLARSLLKAAPFVHESGASTDDQWTIYFVDTANRLAALEWLADLRAVTTGKIRPVLALHQTWIHDIIATDKPHRAAQQLAESHARGEISAGLIAEPAAVRSLLDRLHQREPLFFSALLTLLNHHLVDLVVLLRQLIPEDVALKNEIVKAGLSRDPFLQSRQDAAVEIRNLLLRFQLINPIDQQKNISITNPYAVDLEIVAEGDQLTLPIGGNPIIVPREKFLEAIHTIRRNLYRGDQFSSFDTQAPWMRADIAYAFRFIKQRIDARTDLTPMDALYMLERAVDA